MQRNAYESRFAIRTWHQLLSVVGASPELHVAREGPRHSIRALLEKRKNILIYIYSMPHAVPNPFPPTRPDPHP